MVLAVSAAFIIGAFDGSLMALELPIFTSLVTSAALPSLIEPFFKVRIGDISTDHFIGPGSYIFFALTYSIDLMFTLWATLRLWNPPRPPMVGRCDFITEVYSGLSRLNNLSPTGHKLWIALSSFGTLLAVFLLLPVTALIIHLSYDIQSALTGEAKYSATPDSSPPTSIFSTPRPKTFTLLRALWATISIVTVVTCIASIEETFASRHPRKIHLPGLSRGEYGQ
ncbi:hypothetical protein K440DRAFT_680264 [Wilcoxina mikolae CBS 423.85]|nr:hypothetical protein K440DRAFT_680264 [Wilcoxina mikolae CBS 423.85]